MPEDLKIFTVDFVANYYRDQGYHLLRTESGWWFNEYRQGLVYFYFPPHYLISPGPEEIRKFFKLLPYTLALRFIGPGDGPGKSSGIWVCRKPYNLDSLDKKSRNQVRRGLEKCKISQIPFSEIRNNGWEAHSDTFDRHRKKTSDLGIDQSLDDIQAFKAWGAYIDEKLIAYVVLQFIQDWATILVARSASSYLMHYPNNALIYTVVHNLLASENVQAVSYGWDSLVPNLGLENFKLGMGFKKEPVKQRMIIRPILRPIFSRRICRLVTRLVPRNLKNHTIRQVMGLLGIISESY